MSLFISLVGVTLGGLQPGEPRVDLEQGLSLAGVSVRDVLLPHAERVFFAYLLVVKGHKPSQQHAWN